MASLINSNESWRGRDVEWGRGKKKREREGKPLFVFLLQGIQYSFKVIKKITVGSNSGECSTDPCLYFMQLHKHTHLSLGEIPRPLEGHKLLSS